MPKEDSWPIRSRLNLLFLFLYARTTREGRIMAQRPCTIAWVFNLHSVAVLPVSSLSGGFFVKLSRVLVFLFHAICLIALFYVLLSRQMLLISQLIQT